jgi:hypothetical protein
MPYLISYETNPVSATTTHKFKGLDLIVARAVPVFSTTTVIKLMLLFLMLLHALLLSKITASDDIFNKQNVYFLPTECIYVFCMTEKKQQLFFYTRFT